MRTCTTMIYTDGTTTRYGVFVGKMVGRAFILHRADMVAVIELVKTEPDYRKMTARYATPEAPAVSWQA